MNNKFIIENNSSSFYTISDTLYDSNAIELTLKKYIYIADKNFKILS